MARGVTVEIVGDSARLTRALGRTERAAISRLLPWRRRPLARFRAELRIQGAIWNG